MKAFRRLGRRLASKAPSPSRALNGSGFVLLDPGKKLEEEHMLAYDKGLYFPVRLGDVYSSRYQVLSKLGYGANSTVWFCRDLRKHCYIAMKVCIHEPPPNTEVEVLRHISTTKSDHAGRSGIRAIKDHFHIDGPKGKYQCIIYEVLLTSLLHFQAIFDPPRLNKDLVRGALQQLLLALDFLHNEAHVVHTDIQAKNIIIGSRDMTIFEEWDKEEQSDPSARKINNDAVVYQSRPSFHKGNIRSFALPILSDFGEARIGDVHKGMIQPDIYRAPEVVLGMEWTSKVDIWNVGVLICDLLEGRHLFDARGPDGSHSETRHLAEMIAVLGPPPVRFLQKSRKSSNYWDGEGKWKGAVDVRQNSLEDYETNLEEKDHEKFIEFLRKMLQWEPEQRQTARELLADPWLN